MSVVDPVARRREQLYGAARVDELRSLRRSLTQDHISNVTSTSKSRLPPWASTTKLNYKGTQPQRTAALSWDSGLQNKAHFDMRGDAAPVDSGLYTSSLTNNDYKKHHTQRKPTLRPDDQINLPDMNPRFFRDRSLGTSFYASDFSTSLQHHTTLPELQRARTEMRRNNVKDVRTTHFQLGNDDTTFQTETVSSFKSDRPKSGIRLDPLSTPFPPRLYRSNTEPIETASSMARKMMEEERESYVFRRGDYNVTAPKPKLSTFQRDYDTSPKEPKSAAFIEPTQIAKGRFLQDSDALKSSIKEEMILTPDPEDESTRTNDKNGAILKSILLQYDTMRTGFISLDLLHRACNSLLDPIPKHTLDKLIQSSKEGPDSTIDYGDFLRQLELKCLPTNEQTIADGVVDANGENDPPKGTVQETSRRGNVASAEVSGSSDPVLTDAASGKDYHTGAHFQFGSDEDKTGSIYYKDYNSKILKKDEKPTKSSGPKSSEVMHRTDGVGFGTSTKQGDFVNFQEVDKQQLRSILVTRDKQGLRNKDRHDKNSVIFTCDKNNSAKDRHRSLSHESYVNFPRSSKVTTVPPLPKYRYLDADGALPYPANLPKRSETSEAYGGCTFMSTPAESEYKRTVFNAENTERVRDSRRVHFKLGNDEPQMASEAQDSYHEVCAVTDEVSAAGTKNQKDPKYPHHMISKNTQDLSRDPMVHGIFDGIRLAKKSYYNTAPNPSDPLHVHLRRVIMEMDPDHTGHVDQQVLKDVCEKFQINVGSDALDRLVQRCDKDGNSKVDYHQFIRSLTLEQIPEPVSTSHSGSLMRHDYRPLGQRSFTNAQMLTMRHMNMKPLVPQDTHFFHRDNSGENQFKSITIADFIKPELMTAASI